MIGDAMPCLRQILGLVLLMYVCLGGMPAALAAAPADAAQPRAVYHLDDSARAMAAIRNINNQMRAAPGTRIVVVALGNGIDFLLKDAKDDRGNPYEPMIDDLIAAGVEFKACNNTLTTRKIERSRVHPDAGIVESGVAEITRLQFFEGFAYVKP